MSGLGLLNSIGGGIGKTPDPKEDRPLLSRRIDPASEEGKKIFAEALASTKKSYPVAYSRVQWSWKCKEKK